MYTSQLQCPPKKIMKRKFRPQHCLPRRVARSFNISLPADDVLDNIFSFVPVKIAAKMSILAPRFKHSWKNSSILVFDQCRRERSRFIEEVDRVFNLHSGPIIRTFRPNFIQTGVESYVHKWIEKSMEKKVEEVELNFLNATPQFEISTEFFNIESLKIVKLYFCVVDLPPLLKGSAFLKTLVLKKSIIVTLTFINTIFKHCMLLEYLDITQSRGLNKLKILAENLKKFKVLKIGDCSNLVDIEIVSPTLRSFHYCGNLIGIRVLKAYQLKDVLFNISPRRRYRPFPLAGRFLCGIVHVTVLTTTVAFLESLLANSLKEVTTDALREMNLIMWRLSELQVFMEGSTFCNVYDIACVLKNCPNIERFFIDLSEFSFESGHYWEAHHKHLFEQYNEPMTKLRVIKIKDFKHQRHEIELVKFLLKSATSLETLILVNPKGYRATAQDLELVGFDNYLHNYKASPNAEIKMYPLDRSLIDPTHTAKTWF